MRAEDGPTGSGSYLNVLNKTVVDEVDKRCALYQAIYDVLGK